MGLRASLSRELRTVREILSGRHVPALPEKNAIPADIGLRLVFPEAVDTPEKKVIYALYKEGDQCLCNLKLLTGLPQDLLTGALRTLSKSGPVKKEKLPPGLPGDGNPMYSFSLRKSP